MNYGLVCPHCQLQTDVDPSFLNDESPMPYCPGCGGQLIDNEQHCSQDFDDDEDDFEPCSRCDGHPACADFGCAF
jgi:hypothetical protein